MIGVIFQFQTGFGEMVILHSKSIMLFAIENSFHGI
jgi:hypothetical protein